MRRREYIAGGVGLAAVLAGGAYVTLDEGGAPDRVSPVEVDLLEASGSPSGTISVPAPETYTVLDLFSYTCLACPPQMDNLRRAHETLGDRVSFVSLHPTSLVDDVEQPESVLEFWANHGGPWAVGLDPDDHFHELFGQPSHPYTVVIDPDGRVIWAETGKTEPARIVEAVEEAGQA